MSVDEFGVLGQEGEEKKIELENKFKDIFEECYNLNKFAQEVKNEFQINNKEIAQMEEEDGRKIYAVCCFIKILNGFQAAIILSRYGLTMESNVILRSLLETFFVLENICKREKFFGSYVKSDKKNILTLKNVFKNNSDKSLQELENWAKDKKGEELKDEIERENIKKLNFEELAGEVGLNDYYVLVYRSISFFSAHPTPRAIEQYLNKNSDIISFHQYPGEEDIATILITAAKILLHTLTSMLKLFNIKKSDDITNFNDKLASLETKYFKDEKTQTKD